MAGADPSDFTVTTDDRPIRESSGVAVLTTDRVAGLIALGAIVALVAIGIGLPRSR